MSLRNENFHKKETDILQKITIANDAIRRKHKLIKLGKETVEQTLNNTFKPIATPLEKIVDGLEIRKTVNSVEEVQSEDKENIYPDEDNDGEVTFMSAIDERADEREDIYGSFHGRFTVKIFFSTKYFFLPFHFENNPHAFFFNVILENFEI